MRYTIIKKRELEIYKQIIRAYELSNKKERKRAERAERNELRWLTANGCLVGVIIVLAAHL